MRPFTSWLGAIAALVSACAICDETPRIEVVELGVEVELHAVAPSGGYSPDDMRSYHFLAVGDSGVVVAWGIDRSRESLETFVETFDLGDADLHGAWVASSGSDPTAWWVVGTAGTVATSDNLGRTWNQIVLPGGGADLFGITDFAGQIVIVGDELVLARNFDGSWTEVPAPVGGWGSLRAVASHYGRLYAVGLGGAVWSTDDPAGAWVAENVGVDVDLFDVGGLAGPESVVIVGAQGTLLFKGNDGWMQSETDVAADLVDFAGGFVLGTDGVVYRVILHKPLPLSESRPGATALYHHVHADFATTVGDGIARTLRRRDCHH
jgi:photosystem II stability/assembly factor-like uncharacterized protein